jgi:diketogulonate reductase-like aldo/keto reductase
MKTPTLKLNDDVAIPVLGLGTWQLKGQDAEKSIKRALDLGYRHIDTADAYGNHKTIGKALQDYGIDRSELHVTSKLWITDFKKQAAIDAGHRVLEELQMDYLDLYLMHWPKRDVPMEETLEAMQELKDEGLIRAIGVSNFTIHHLEDALKVGVEITNNQVEFHPSLYQKELKSFCDEKGIVITGYSPLARGEDLKLPVVKEVAQKHNRSEAQVLINWLIQQGIVAIPKASSLEHVEDNLKSLEWELAEEDIEKLNQLNSDNRTVKPDFHEFDY